MTWHFVLFEKLNEGLQGDMLKPIGDATIEQLDAIYHHCGDPKCHEPATEDC